MLQIVAINVGLPKTFEYAGKSVHTAGHKSPVPQAQLRRLGFDGDGQADRRHHGGPDKAVCVYSFDHYCFWESELGRGLEPGAFSENLTVSGLNEADVCVGDTFRAGEALVQLSQPRQPCSKLAGRHARLDLPSMIHARGFSGFYFRVLEEGLVRIGDLLRIEVRQPGGVSVAFANQVMYRQRADDDSLQRLLAVDALSEAWRSELVRRAT